jgi:subtilisin family serine protease
MFKEGAEKAGIQALSQRAGIAMASSADYQTNLSAAVAEMGSDGGLFFETLGVAVVNTPPQAIHSLSLEMTDGDSVFAIEPERVVYALDDAISVGGVIVPPWPIPAERASSMADYLRGYRDAVNHVVDKVLKPDHLPSSTEEAFAAAKMNESEVTWGLQVTKVANSTFSGQGIRIAVLDTGFDLGHPDFVGRAVVSSSFVPGEAVQDGHGHGTHCIGTSCGPQRPGTLPRYGIAYKCEIYAGKVLSNTGSGVDSGILAGIDWAIRNGCAIISMSLGSPVAPGQGYSQIFERVAKRALSAGTLIIAAAGNDSHRPASIAPVGHPANCPSIMAVGALDSQLQIGYFSDGGINPQGGQVDVVGPGVQIRSSWPRPTLYNTISGTSMATPHTAGIAGLWAEANPKARGGALWTLLVQGARRLSIPSRDVGSGLVQAP